MLEPQCKVRLLHNSPLWIGANGARTCWDSGDKSDTCIHQLENKWNGNKKCYYSECKLCGKTTSANILEPQCGPKDAELLDRVGNKFKHASILEHLIYCFYITDISRALLQELSRHRMTSPSVKSTRYTLKELKEEDSFTDEEGYFEKDEKARAHKYLVFTGNDLVDLMSIRALENLRQCIQSGTSNDLAKYCLPEAYKTEEQLTINARSLQNLLSLRSDKSALWEIRQLAHAIYDALPEDHKYLFVDHLKEES
jgi:thymidylate synthase (FAD)